MSYSTTNATKDRNICSHNNGDLSATASMKLSAAVNKDINVATFADTSLTGTIKKGTIFTIAGDSRPYVVTKDAAAASNAVTVTFYPAARQDFASNTAITLVANHAASMAFHRNAFSMVSRPLAKPMGTASESYAIISDSGLSLRVVFGYDINKKRDICSIDMLCGFKTMIPELACRLLG